MKSFYLFWILLFFSQNSGNCQIPMKELKVVNEKQFDTLHRKTVFDFNGQITGTSELLRDKYEYLREAPAAGPFRIQVEKIPSFEAVCFGKQIVCKEANRLISYGFNNHHGNDLKFFIYDLEGNRINLLNSPVGVNWYRKENRVRISKNANIYVLGTNYDENHQLSLAKINKDGIVEWIKELKASGYFNIILSKNCNRIAVFQSDFSDLNLFDQIPWESQMNSLITIFDSTGSLIDTLKSPYFFGGFNFLSDSKLILPDNGKYLVYEISKPLNYESFVKTGIFNFHDYIYTVTGNDLNKCIFFNANQWTLYEFKLDRFGEYHPTSKYEFFEERVRKNFPKICYDGNGKIQVTINRRKFNLEE